ncbi:acyltransferase family protein [Bifidobacterium criceti]|uniref:Symporter n=1 Tax=Bifidobacterium criceti TaxID=1960969 RepID=A0A2A2EIZ8_9BIFI|nr:acyltransferase [Bifidobacterium criceti]PAU68991.1 symporter [Bifidobacterium criceti]
MTSARPKVKTIPKHATQRNSSIELLRIMAMFMIISSHYVAPMFIFNHNLPPFSLKSYFFLIVGSLGKIGVIIFFSISAWYLCMEKQPSTRKALKRSWLLEREVLFYSLGLVIVFHFLGRQYLSLSIILESIFPTATATIWWYVTAYIIFLLLSPSITRGLHAIGKRAHLSLCIIILIGWGLIAGILPLGILESRANDFTNFLFIYVLISFYRWYFDDCSTRAAWTMLIAGVSMLILSIGAIQIAGTVLHNTSIRNNSIYLAESCIKFPILLIGFGTIVLCEKKFFVNKIINTIATTTLGIYLVHDYPAVIKMIWQSRIGIENVYDNRYMIAVFFAAILGIFTICSIIDFIRQGLFRITVDRHKGRCFEMFCQFVTSQQWAQHIYNTIMTKPLPRDALIPGKELANQADEPIPQQ